jgi:DNA-binding transcriptional ArsR family regulator
MDKKLLWWVFGVARGGSVRARIVQKLHERPYNANQLAEELGLHYTTVRYHLNILLKNRIVTTLEDTYLVMYFLTEEMEEDYPVFCEIYKKLKINNRK